MRAWKQHLGWKIFSLLVSVFLWATFARDPFVSAFVSVPLEYKSMPGHLEIASAPVDSVSLDLRGSSEDIKRFSAARSPVILDFSNIRQPGERTFYVDARNVELPPGMTIERAFPSQLRFQFEQRVVRDVPVQVHFSGQPREGLVLVRHEVRPQTVSLVGPESHVKRVEFAVTDMIDLAGVTGDAELRVNAFIREAQVRFKQPPRVVVKLYFEQRN